MTEKLNQARHVVEHKIGKFDNLMCLIRTISSIVVITLQLLIFSKIYG